jgi:hypothetical protein
MPIYGAGSKCLGRVEKETELLRFHAPQAPGNSQWAPTPDPIIWLEIRLLRSARICLRVASMRPD